MILNQPANPFGAPLYWLKETDSTQSAARRLAEAGAPHGTSIIAERQRAGRGRIAGRVWQAAAGESLLFTLILRFGSLQDLPTALSLRAGLAVALALETIIKSVNPRLARTDSPSAISDRELAKTEDLPALSVFVKWPNDILLQKTDLTFRGSGTAKPGINGKVAGILVESDGSAVYLGIGLNLTQDRFQPELAAKATSLKLALNGQAPDWTVVLSTILDQLYWVLSCQGTEQWLPALEQRLFWRGETVLFAVGPADSDQVIQGTIRGLGPAGELLICPADGTKVQAFVTGELR